MLKKYKGIDPINYSNPMEDVETYNLFFFYRKI